MIVIDTSAWIELFRETGSPVERRLDALLQTQASELAVTEVVVGEVLAGVGPSALESTRARLVRLHVLRLRGLRDFELAAELSRACRAKGEAVRQLSDCLVAVPAIRAGATILHADRDFEKLARHTPLRLEPV